MLDKSIFRLALPAELQLAGLQIRIKSEGLLRM